MSVLILNLILSVLPLWKDIQTTSVNAQTRRTEVIWYDSREEALAKGFPESTHYLSLSGRWDFTLSSTDGTLHAQGPIQVPGNWEVQGYDVPIYVNHPYEFGRRHPDPGELPEQIPIGTYRRSFTLPSAWKGKNIYLNVCGSKSGTYVKVNGADVGYHWPVMRSRLSCRKTRTGWNWCCTDGPPALSWNARTSGASAALSGTST